MVLGLSRADIRKYKSLFPFTVEVKECPDCSTAEDPAYMVLDRVRDPAAQSDFRGVQAYVCEECGRAERADPYDESPGPIDLFPHR